MIDIIIPTYKNKEGLMQTLQSIDWSNKQLHVTIVDDCSNTDYTLIQEQFPQIEHWIYLPKNCGPGCARQKGIEATNHNYIMFIDTGDYFIPSFSQFLLVNEIKNNLRIMLFNWSYTQNKYKAEPTNNRLHGKIYNRAFIQDYDITFCPDCSYANEDIGFNRACRMIIKNLEQKYNITLLKTYSTPMLIWAEDKNSLTNKNREEFVYKNQNKNLAITDAYALQIAKKNKVSNTIIQDEVSDIISHMYLSFIYTAVEAPEFLPQSWEGVKHYYNEVYQFTPIDNEILQLRVSQVASSARKHFKNKLPPFPINLRRFIIELGKYDNPPSHFLTTNQLEEL